MDLTVERDAGQLNAGTFDIAGQDQRRTSRSKLARRSTRCPYLPDLLVARRRHSRPARVTPAAAVGPRRAGRSGRRGRSNTPTLTDINPRPGRPRSSRSTRGGDWQKTTGFRLALGELAAGETDARPRGIRQRVLLTVFLPKGQTAVVPLSSYMTAGGPQADGPMAVAARVRRSGDHLRRRSRRTCCRGGRSI